jgi:sec-independent protein translocase protein TatA
MPMGIGVMEIVLVLGIALLVFGPRKLPEVGRSVGHGIRELKDSLAGGDRGERDKVGRGRGA